MNVYTIFQRSRLGTSMFRSCILKTILGCIVVSMISISPLSSQQRMDKMWGEQRAKAANATNVRGHFFEWGNYAMFIHWGLFSHLGNKWQGKTYYGIGEWMMDVNMANADKNEYKAVAREFNPSQFDAMKIARLAKDAGMKYIIITSKHHDGFAMFDSQCDEFNIVDATPFGRDPMKELADACKQLGLGFGFYYSHNQDWTTPGASGASRVDAKGNPKTFDDYFHEKCLPQVEEITKNYGDIELIWFDTPGGIPQKYAEKLVEVVHKNQPGALVSGRIGYNLGDYQTLGDMEVPLENIDGLWESVDVTNDAWGYAWYDQNWKTPKQILMYLISTIARGGTYMMNIGPDGLGNVPDYAEQTLLSSGKWIGKYPQMIYGADPSPWKHALPWGDVVCQDNKLYLAVYDWPATGKLYIPGLKSEIISAAIIGEKKPHKVKISKESSWTVLDIPHKAPDPMISIIELTIKGDIVVDNTIAPDPETGIEELSVKFASAKDCTIRKESWMEKFGEWKHVYCVSDLFKDGNVIWEIEVKDPGIYHVDLKVKGNGRQVWEISTDEGLRIQNQQGSSSIYGFKPVGWIRFDKPGKHTVSVRLLEGNRQDVSLSAVKIKPVRF